MVDLNDTPLEPGDAIQCLDVQPSSMRGSS